PPYNDRKHGQPFTLRYLFGNKEGVICKNVAHGSATVKDAKRELALATEWFLKAGLPVTACSGMTPCGAQSWKGPVRVVGEHGDVGHKAADGTRWSGDARPAQNGADLPADVRTAWLAAYEVEDPEATSAALNATFDALDAHCGIPHVEPTTPYQG